MNAPFCFWAPFAAFNWHSWYVMQWLGLKQKKTVPTVPYQLFQEAIPDTHIYLVLSWQQHHQLCGVYSNTFIQICTYISHPSSFIKTTGNFNLAITKTCLAGLPIIAQFHSCRLHRNTRSGRRILRFQLQLLVITLEVRICSNSDKIRYFFLFLSRCILQHTILNHHVVSDTQNQAG